MKDKLKYAIFLTLSFSSIASFQTIKSSKHLGSKASRPVSPAGMQQIIKEVKELLTVFVVEPFMTPVKQGYSCKFSICESLIYNLRFRNS